jgi:hypothetical protein
MARYLWLICIFVERKNRFLPKKDIFSMGSANGKILPWPGGSMPGQKAIRLAKKGCGPSFPDAGSPFAAQPSLSPASLCGEET